MTELERRTMAIAGGLLLVASALRVGFTALTPPPDIPNDSIALSLLLEQSRELVEGAARRAAPLAEGERIDPNTASAEELDRLPGIGPATAAAIVAARAERGGFRSANDLLQVSGIGPGTLGKIRDYLALAAGSGASTSAGGAPRSRRGRSSRSARRVAQAPSLDINAATAAELETLPGVGPALAGRIVALRTRRGAFRAVEELLDVSGIGPATLERLKSRVRIGRR